MSIPIQRNRLQKLLKKNNGFTLVELMIVIAIIGILAAVVMPQLTNNTNKSRFSELKLSVSSIKSALESCYSINNGDPLCNSAPVTQQIRGQLTAASLTRAANGALVDNVTITGTTAPVITATASNDFGLGNKTYILTGVVTVNGVDTSISSWEESGTGCAEGWC